MCLYEVNLIFVIVFSREERFLLIFGIKSDEKRTLFCIMWDVCDGLHLCVIQSCLVQLFYCIYKVEVSVTF